MCSTTVIVVVSSSSLSRRRRIKNDAHIVFNGAGGTEANVSTTLSSPAASEREV